MPWLSMRMSKGQDDELVSFCFNRGISLSKILHLWFPAVFNSWFRKYHSGHGPFPQPSCEFLPTAEYDIPSMVRGKDLQQISWITDQILAMAPVLSSRFLTWYRVDVFSEQHARHSPTDFGNGSPESFKISACGYICCRILLSRCSCIFESTIIDSLKRDSSSPAQSTFLSRSLRSFLLWNLFFHNKFPTQS